MSVLVALVFWRPGLVSAAQYPMRLAQLEEKILEPGTSSAASNLNVSAECASIQPGESVATFHWTPVPDRERRQRVDVTKFRDGFERKAFETIAVLPAAQASVEWRGSEAGINYYWRVLTFTADGWGPSAVARFEAPTCPVDFEELGKPPQ